MSGQYSEVIPVSGGGREFVSNVWKSFGADPPSSFVVGLAPQTATEFSGMLKRMTLSYDVTGPPDVVIRVGLSVYVRNLTSGDQVGEKLCYVEFPVYNVEQTVNYSQDLDVPFAVPAGCVLVAGFTFTDYDHDIPNLAVCSNFRWISADIVLPA